MTLPSAAEVVPRSGAPRPRNVRLVLLWSLVLLSVLPWRQGAYFTGGLDPVVLAKSAVGGLTLVCAWFMWGGARRRSDLGITTLAIVGAYLVVTVLGGWAAGSLLPSAIVAVRVGLLLMTVVLVVTSCAVETTMAAARDAIILVGGVVALTGAGSLATEGRLRGGVLPLNPNDLAMMFGFAVLVTVWQALERRATRLDAVAAVGMFVLVALTGSRTGLVALLLAIALCALTYRRRPGGAFVIATVALPAMLYLVTSTGMAEAYFNRGGGASVLTLNSRTIAWTAAFDQPYDFWTTLFGRGLSAKTVGVAGTFWDTQVLDSSWVSAYVQGGAIGLALLALWCVRNLVRTLRLGHPRQALFLPIVVYALIYSVTASGLIDAYVLFLLMLLCSLAIDLTHVEATDEVEGVDGVDGVDEVSAVGKAGDD
ncbi:O-antigen ligase family protein [Nocardioides dongxiaopingii]|uniref:O-antigen ligase family protein n=1 Tax=Nocardioides dongxiaopingii TaxID=2576036 RepID=UPI0010C76E39|nr:O-antigen ligase family protein [Nocardioides dongxiaopingii]